MYWSAALHSLTALTLLFSLSRDLVYWGWAPHGPGQTGFQGGLDGPLKGDVLVSRSALSHRSHRSPTALLSLKGPGLLGDGLPMVSRSMGLGFVVPHTQGPGGCSHSLWLPIHCCSQLSLSLHPGPSGNRGSMGPGFVVFHTPRTWGLLVLTHSRSQFTAALDSPLSHYSPWPLWN